MSLIAHIQSALAGAWSLAWGRDDWRDKIDLSTDGFFRSFIAIPLSLPFHIFIAVGVVQAVEAFQPADGDFQANATLATMAFSSFAFVLDWLLTIAVLLFATRLLKVENNFSVAVIAFNWTRLLTLVASAIGPALFLLGARSGSLFFLIIFATTIWMLLVLWRVIHKSLLIPISQTLAVFLLVMIVGVLVNVGVSAIQ